MLQFIVQLIVVPIVITFSFIWLVESAKTKSQRQLACITYVIVIIILCISGGTL